MMGKSTITNPFRLSQFSSKIFIIQACERTNGVSPNPLSHLSLQTRYNLKYVSSSNDSQHLITEFKWLQQTISNLHAHEQVHRVDLQNATFHK